MFKKLCNKKAELQGKVTKLSCRILEININSTMHCMVRLYLIVLFTLSKLTF